MRPTITAGGGALLLNAMRHSPPSVNGTGSSRLAQRGAHQPARPGGPQDQRARHRGEACEHAGALRRDGTGADPFERAQRIASVAFGVVFVAAVLAPAALCLVPPEPDARVRRAMARLMCDVLGAVLLVAAFATGMQLLAALSRPRWRRPEDVPDPEWQPTSSSPRRAAPRRATPQAPSRQACFADASLSSAW
jgi:hypothetical protein